MKFFFFFIVLAPLAALAQNQAKIYCERENIAVKSGETFSNKLIVSNPSAQRLLLVKDFTDAAALIPLPDTISLLPHQTKTFFTKYLATPALFRKNGTRFLISYKTSDHANSFNTSFEIESNSEQNLVLQPLQNPVYLDAMSKMAQLDFRLTNNTFSGQSVKIIIKSYPDGLMFVNNNSEFAIAPGEQQIVSVNAQPISAANAFTDYGVSAQAVDANGKVLSTSYTKVIILSSNKQIQNGNYGLQNLANATQLSYWNSSNGFDFYQLMSNGNLNVFKKAKLDYNLNANFYNSTVKGAEVYNSRLSYRDKNIAIKIGNVSENLDFSLFGNGVQSDVFLDSASTLSAYYVNNDYWIYSDISRRPKTADTWAGAYIFAKNNFSLNASFVNNKDRLTNTRQNILHAKTSLNLNKNSQLQLEAGTSRENLRDNSSPLQDGLSAGAYYRSTFGRWSINAENYFSSPHYAGLRRGTTTLDERIVYQLDQSNQIYGRYAYLSNQPKFVDLVFNTNVANKYINYELGFNTRLGKINLNLRPYYFQQGYGLQIGSDSFAYASKSYHLATDINYTKNSHSFSLNADVGRTQSDNPYLNTKSYYNTRIMFNYTNTWWGFNSFAQINPYYLNQEPNVWQPYDFKQIYFGPNIHLLAVKNTLSIKASDAISYACYNNGWSNNLQTEATYRLANTWNISAMVNYNKFNFLDNGDYLQSQLSISKHFVKKNNDGNKTLSLLFYADENANGTLDKNEETLNGIIVSLDNSPAQTNKKGKVVFSNLKPGDYTPELLNAHGWHSLKPIRITLFKNKSYKIPLVKSTTLYGNIRVLNNSYFQTECNIEGIKVNADDGTGNLTTTFTDANGNFRFDLPLKTYTISLEPVNGAFEVINNVQKIDTEKNRLPLTFEIRDTSRKVNVKKF